MAKKTSIHVDPCKIGSARQHNDREKKLDYVRSDLTHLNQSLIFDDRPLDVIKAEIAEVVKDKTGRKMQDKAVPLIEGLGVIDESTTMEEVVEAVNEFGSRWGLTPIGIWLHRDEGHYDKRGNWKPNLHAHIIWNKVNMKTGKSSRIQRQDTADMQTVWADILKMQRGKKSTRKHLDAIDYKIQKQQERIKELDRDITRKTAQNKAVSLLGIVKTTISNTAKENVAAQNGELRIKNQNQEYQIESLTNQTNRLQKKLQDAEDKVRELESEKMAYETAVKQIENFGLENAVSAAALAKMVKNPMEVYTPIKTLSMGETTYTAKESLSLFWSKVKHSLVVSLRKAIISIGGLFKYAPVFWEDFQRNGNDMDGATIQREVEAKLQATFSGHGKLPKPNIKLSEDEETIKSLIDHSGEKERAELFIDMLFDNHAPSILSQLDEEKTKRQAEDHRKLGQQNDAAHKAGKGGFKR